jgi:hypothetical protein
MYFLINKDTFPIEDSSPSFYIKWVCVVISLILNGLGRQSIELYIPFDIAFTSNNWFNIL